MRPRTTAPAGRVAIKAVRLDTIASQQDHTRTIERIQRQAQMLSMLSHPHIVRVLETVSGERLPVYRDGVS